MFGSLEIKRGLKRKERRRTLPINAEFREALLYLLKLSRSQYVFTAMEDPTKPLSPWTLESSGRGNCLT
jgi:hypothetical protein